MFSLTGFFKTCKVEKARNQPKRNISNPRMAVPGALMNTGGPSITLPNRVPNTLPKLLGSPKRQKTHPTEKVQPVHVSAPVKDLFHLEASDESTLQRDAEIVANHIAKLKELKISARYQAAEALAVLGDKARPARSILEATLMRDESVHVRKSCARALGELGDKKAEKVLHHAVEFDDDKFVRIRAQEALEALNCQLSA